VVSPAGADSARDRLVAVLDRLGDAVVVAVSGGVDSLTLATLAHRRLADGVGGVTMAHAVSPAVPPEATARVRDRARQEGWRIEVIEAGEFADPAYLENPANRCFFCKANLYGTIRARIPGSQIVSGANLDDLGEYRPGLDAAHRHGVRHPFVEAGIDKATIRSLAREEGLGNLAELPASPCLSSRVETGIRIEPGTLRFIHAVERLVVSALAPETVRCRVRASGIVVELDPASLARLSSEAAAALRSRIAEKAPAGVADRSPVVVAFAVYRTGSAFLRERA
jgi:uncharacterized protein